MHLHIVYPLYDVLKGNSSYIANQLHVRHGVSRRNGWPILTMLVTTGDTTISVKAPNERYNLALSESLASNLSEKFTFTRSITRFVSKGNTWQAAFVNRMVKWMNHLIKNETHTEMALTGLRMPSRDIGFGLGRWNHARTICEMTFFSVSWGLANKNDTPWLLDTAGNFPINRHV